jgi:4-amino-4-deoxy-L-arabinose transferase-like glycosyltransferase
MKNLSTVLSYRYKIFLLGIFLIALFLRVMYLPINAISFAYDQARDAFIAQEIISGQLKLLGPPVSGIPGLFHGVLYYYVIAPFYFLGNGNPQYVAYFMSFISSLGVISVYFLAYLLTKNRLPAILSALLFAFSYESSQYANLLTNASMGAWFIPVFYLGLLLWINKKYKYSSALTGVALGLSVQSEVALMYHFVPLLIWLYSFRKNISTKSVLIFSAGFLIAVLPMLLSEVKFGFKSIGAVNYLLAGKDGITETKTLMDYFSTVLSQSGLTFAYNIFPTNIVFGGLIGFLISYLSIKNGSLWGRFLLSGIFAYAIALPFGGWNMKHLLVGAAPLISILIAVFLWNEFAKIKFILFTLIAILLVSNTLNILKENKNGQTIFPLQTDLVLSKELDVIDYTYSSSGGQPFSTSTLTSPLFVNTLWSYLYNWHGYQKYGYKPYWIGRDQVGQLGDNLETPPNSVLNHFFISEPTNGIPELWITYAEGDQGAISAYDSEQKFGEITVQKRRLIR